MTTLQLARAYAILANHGERIPVSLLKLDTVPAADKVLSRKISNEVVEMLKAVISGKEGTGHLAQVSGYTVAGKTGTAYIAGPNGYDKKKYVGDFVGIAPATNPQLVIAVVIRDPHDKKGLHFGGDIAAPVFAKVMAASLRILNIPPDNIHNSNDQAK